MYENVDTKNYVLNDCVNNLNKEQGESIGKK